MSYWKGTHWVEDAPTPITRPRSRGANWIATLLMILGLVALMAPMSFIAAARSSSNLSVWWGDARQITTTPSGDSHFTAGGCNFRANDHGYYLVIYGPAPNTARLGYWVDPFPVGSDGCGGATPSWTSSGVTGMFDVYVVRSPSGNPWQARPVTNIVKVNVTSL